MQYIAESLTGNEKVVIVGRFHWIYFVGAVFWLIFGVLACVAIISGGVVFEIKTGISEAYPNLPDHLYNQGWDNVVSGKGGYTAIIRDLHVLVRGAAFGTLLLGVLLFGHMIMVRATTEIVVTSSRLVLKDGIVSRNVDEMSVNRIESVHVMQSVLGRMLNFGTVMVRGMGIGEIMLPPLADPIAFRNALERARVHHERDRKS